MPIITAIANGKGGTGKTVTATNLAAALAIAERKTLLVDWDPQGNSTTGMGMRKHFYRHHEGIRIAPSWLPNLDLLPAGPELINLERESIKANASLEILKENLVNTQYDNILIDCAPSLSWLTLAALVAASDVLIPMQCEFYSMDGLSQLLQVIELLKLRGHHCDIRGVLLTMYDARSNLTKTVERNVIRYFTVDKVYKTYIHRSIRISEATSYGKPGILYAPKSRGAADYIAFAQEFMAQV